jgi:predicted nucleotidyltransferase component of viral defense system
MISATSVKDRLKNLSAENGKTFQEVLTMYGMERTVYRLSISEYKDFFTLKGGVFLYALFEGEYARATRDIDLLGRNIPNNAHDISKVFEKIFSIECDDALRFDLETLAVKDITEFKEYHGVNVFVMAYLNKTKVPVSIDVGFGDIIYPDRMKMEFPVLLEMEVPEIFAYSIASAISEKFEAIVSLGDANSRYKDYYDIYILAGKYDLDGAELKEAIKETFAHRGTGYGEIFAFTDDFISSAIHQSRWTAFLTKKKALVKADIADVSNLMKTLLLPIIESIKNDTQFDLKWDHEAKSWK